MTCDTDRLLAFLSEELDEPERASYDDHLLGCEDCWTAVREDRRGRALAESLREPAPAGLAERIRLAAEAERQPATRVSQTTPTVVGDTHVRSRRPRRRWAVAVASVGAAAAVAAGVLLTTGSGTPAPAGGAGMAATLDLVRLGAALPAHIAGLPRQAPFMMGSPMTMSMDSLELHVAWYGVDGGEALVAHSDTPFAMPAGGTPSADGRSWTAEMDGVSIYCACRAGAPVAAIVTPMRPRAAMDLAAYLGMPT